MPAAMISIRDERCDDIAAIVDVICQAFAGLEHSDQTEPAIIAGLRNAGALAVSLVADDEGEMVGHVAFSPVRIDGQECGWFGLGPVSVQPRRQSERIGTLLIRAGLHRLRELGANGCVVLGDPAYYARFGFAGGDRLRFAGVPSKYFLWLDLPAGDGAAAGQVDYHPAFVDK